MSKKLSKPFLIVLVVASLISVYFVFQSFLTEIVIAAVLATIFYKPYLKLSVFLGNRKNLAALLMCLLLLTILILPSIKIISYTAEKSVQAYTEANIYFSNNDLGDVSRTSIFKRLNFLNIDFDNDLVKNSLLDFLKKSSNWMISGATSVLVNTTSFLASLVMIILTMFFFFVDGKNMLQKLMHLSPLDDKYDKEIFHKFKEISYTTMISTFVVAIAQGLVGALGFAVVGFPVFLAGVLVALLSLLPYLGSMLFYVPVGIYYLIMGQTWQGIFVLAWGFLIIGTIDNIIRAWMLKGKAMINPIFILFSILGGIIMFGFWGVVLGPLIVSIAATILHIYSLEFCEDGVPLITVVDDHMTFNKLKKKKTKK